MKRTLRGGVLRRTSRARGMSPVAVSAEAEGSPTMEEDHGLVFVFIHSLLSRETTL